MSVLEAFCAYRGKKNHALATFLLFLFLARFSGAQSCPPQAVIVNVLNAHGLPISDLSASSFKASYRGKPLSVLSASFRSDPSTRTYILLDMGASIGGFGAQGINKWKVARAAASEFLNGAPAQAEISLSTFSATIEKTFRSSDGRQAMQNWLNSPESLRSSALKGKAAIHSMILETADAMHAWRPGDSIFVVSDGRGDDNASTAASVAEELSRRGIRLFSFVLDDSRRADFSGTEAGGLVASVGLPNPGAKQLADMVKTSGGLGYTLYPGGSRIGQSFGLSYDYDDHMRQNVRASVSAIEIAVSNFYVLSMSLPDDAGGLHDFQLEVADAQGKKRKDVMVAFPARIPGCRANASH